MGRRYENFMSPEGIGRYPKDLTSIVSPNIHQKILKKTFRNDSRKRFRKFRKYFLTWESGYVKHVSILKFNRSKNDKD